MSRRILGAVVLGLGLWGMALPMGGCGFAHRVRRFPAPTHHVAPPPTGALADVAILDAEGAQTPYAAEPYGEGLSRPMIVSPQGTIVIAPQEEAAPLHLRVMVRSVGRPSGDFVAVHTVTGARDRELVDEVRYLPPMISSPYRLPVQDLANVYNGYRLDDDDDLILVELSDAEGQVVERYLFTSRRVGWHVGLAFDVLVRTPLSPTEDDQPMLSPAFTGGLVLGYHAADRGRDLSLLWDRVALQASLGLGSAELDAAQSEEDLRQALYSVMGGGGIRLLDAVSVQALVNVRSMTTPGITPVWTLGVGVDATRLASFTQDVGRKLLKPNTLSEPPAP